MGSAVHRAIDTNARMLDRPPPVTGASDSAQRTNGLARSPMETATLGATSYPTLDTESSDSCAVSRRSMCPRSASARSKTCASRNEAADAKSGASASADRRPATVRSPTSVVPTIPSKSRVLLLKSTSQFRVLALHALQLRHLRSPELARTRYRRRDTDRFGVLQVRVDGSYHDARLYRYQVDSYERDAYPRVDHDALVQYTIKNIDEGTTTRRAFDGHWREGWSLKRSAVAMRLTCGCVRRRRLRFRPSLLRESFERA